MDDDTPIFWETVRAVNYDPYGHYWLVSTPRTISSSQTYTFSDIIDLGYSEPGRESNVPVLALTTVFIVTLVVIGYILGRIL